MWVPNLENIKQVAKNAGLDDIAVTGVEPIVEARAAIEERKRQGLHGLSLLGHAETPRTPS